MHHLYDQYFRDLKDAAIEVDSFGWTGYAAYCLEYESGLRANAFATLGTFIKVTTKASFTERRRFVSWLSAFADERKGRDRLIPYPLRKKVIEPTLDEWVQREPQCPEPHRWLGGRDHLERALELVPTDQIAIRKLVVLC